MASSCQRLRKSSLSTIFRSPVHKGQRTHPAVRKEQTRVVVMGASRVGKTCIIEQFLFDQFPTRYKRTIEQLHRADYELPDGSALTLDILDTCGSHEFPAMRTLSIRTSDAFMFVYAVNDAESWEEVERLRNQIIEIRSSSVPIVIVANKMDLPEIERKVQYEVHEMIALEEWNCGYVNSSAKNNVGIVEIFKEVLKQSKIYFNLSPAVSIRRNSLPIVQKSQIANRNTNSSNNYNPVQETNTSINRQACEIN